MANLLVTGAAGFIGTNFVSFWHGSNPKDRIVVLDALTYAGNKNNLVDLLGQDWLEFVHGSICDQELVESLLHKHEINTLVHFAAESHVDRSIKGPDAFIDTNIVGTHSLLKAAKKYWIDENAKPEHLFHHVSTDEVYGTLGADDPAFSETTAYAPNSPYAASKASSDHLVRSYHHTFGLRVTTSNCSNNYGPYQFPEKLLPVCILNILKGKDLPIYGDGLQIRDWLYVDDHNRGIELVIKNGRHGETYNIGGNNEWANIDVVNLLCELIDRRFAEDNALGSRFPDSPCARGASAKSLITYVTDRPGHDTRYAINASKIMTELGYDPQEGFDSGLKKTIDWYLSNQNWWQSIQDGSYRK
ncbi:MAG: dTDP-glucose 4,6-dehydratase [Gammaproteobacteria bacterium]|nr:dTDP-glucose 4,6-dehydratase [Gammaproteobacteria bacterium]MBT6481119.1 dTDP-glucose 4,6-dehydratase [Gammaproteobacteria bacterium]MBT7226004.1 dTDP-glucose 4,6-dehydratase [Gammaproteobacteria bacterium]